jgi:hypothetical protein
MSTNPISPTVLEMLERDAAYIAKIKAILPYPCSEKIKSALA